MKKYFFIPILLLIAFSVGAQKSVLDETPIESVSRIYKAFIKQPGNTEIPENRQTMQNALLNLYQTAEKKDLTLLISVWLDYDPPNFPTRKLVERILFKHKVATIEKINELLASKNTWQSKNTSPGSDLEKLRELTFEKGQL